MGLDLTVASDGALPAGGRPVIPAHPDDPDRSAGQIASCCGPVDAVVAADTPMLLLAAAVADRRRLPGETVELPVPHPAEESTPLLRREPQNRPGAIPAVADADRATGQAGDLDAVAVGVTQRALDPVRT
jgi:hypothetical protein